MSIKIIAFLFISIFVINGGNANTADTSKHEIEVNFELRPRFEYRYNNVQPPENILTPSIYITERNRISLFYKYNKKFEFIAEPQEIHVLKDDVSKFRTGSLNFFQLFFVAKFKNYNVKFGRQSILLDNGRIFSDAPWAQQGRSHEGVNLTFNKQYITHDLFFLMTRKYSDFFESFYSPVASHRYRSMLVYHNKAKFKGGFSYNNINYVEILPRQSTSESPNLRYTVGGRVQYDIKNTYATINCFYQFGRNSFNQVVRAYYLQPEFKFKLGKNTVRTGLELISGSHASISKGESGSFDIRYGVAWKFMGNMNLFTRFPNDVNDKGLINPYMFWIIPISNHLSLRSDFHLFYTQYNLPKSTHKYLGFENDVSARFKSGNNLELNFGFSTVKSTSLMSNFSKIPDTGKLSVWSYFMVSYVFHYHHNYK